MTINIKDISYEKKVLKPWGEETIFTQDNLKYTFKMIKINKGGRWSLQSHTEKVETFVLTEGKANLIVGSSLDDLQTIPMELKKGYSIPVNTIHRVEAIEDAVIMEGSTPETGTTVRYQDDYHRPDETEEMRNLPNRGWSPNQN